MINFFPNFLVANIRCLPRCENVFIPSLFASLLSSSLFFSSHSVILSPHYPPYQKQHGRFLTPSLPERMMAFCKASLTFESAYEIL